MTPRRDLERGSAVVDFVLVAPLLLLLGVAIVQAALVLHVRATLTAAAAEGARAAALAGSDPGAGVRRARAVLADNVAAEVVQAVSARPVTLSGIPVVAVRIEATLPLVGLLGPTTMIVEGHALREGES